MWFTDEQVMQHFDISNVDEEFLAHVGVGHEDNPPGRGSGRYGFGTGENAYQHVRDFRSMVGNLRAKKDANGNRLVSDIEICKIMGCVDKNGEPNTRILRGKLSIAKDIQTEYEQKKIRELYAQGKTPAEISRELDIGYGTVKNRLDPTKDEKVSLTTMTVNKLRSEMEDKGPIQVGTGVEKFLGVSDTKLKTAIDLLKEEGYHLYYIKTRQMGTGEFTNVKVLAPPDMDYKTVKNLPNGAAIPQVYMEDHELEKVEPPRSVSSSRVAVVYDEQGGGDRDGLIELRPGVPDISLKDATYAQVRIAVDGTHYLKGMAMYSDDLPDGIDIRFNTSKHEGTPMMGTKDNTVLKPMKKDPDNPFGASIKLDDELILAQRHYIDENGERQLSALNIVNEEGDWAKWSKTLPSQFLSKQRPSLAKKQLDEAYEKREADFNDIMALTNPTVKAELLSKFADGCDSASAQLRGAPIKDQATCVLMPFPDIPEGKVYAPHLESGTPVVLVRFPHQGRVEIPSLVVDNDIPSAKKALGNCRDAIGVNHITCVQMAGADTDGDSVLVIPNKNGDIRVEKLQKELIEFNENFHDIYKKVPGMKVMTSQQKQTQMGIISNLITDMTLQDAPLSDRLKAIKHANVIIDAEKHELNWKQSEVDQDIAALKARYQKGGGAATLISRANRDYRIDKQQQGEFVTDPDTGKTKKRYIDPETGEKVSSPAKESDLHYVDVKKAVYDIDPETGRRHKHWENIDYEHGDRLVKDPGTGKRYLEGHPEVEIKETQKTRTQTVPEMYVHKDAYELTSGGSKDDPGTVMEGIYANHANKLKSLANQARLELLRTPPLKYDPSAAKIYDKEVKELKAQLDEVIKKRPFERKAQAIAGTLFAARKAENPDMDKDDIKKLRNQCQKIARERLGLKRFEVTFTDKQWEAVQHGAITNNTLKQLLARSDIDQVRRLSMPRAPRPKLSTAKISSARSMINNGAVIADVAKELGVSVTTLRNALDGKT